MRPIYRICEAARRVAQGDFTVRLSPMRKDGKKDEFEVLFEDFNTMTEELASTEMLKNDFISNVSHELKTPLAVIQNYATILQSGVLTQAERIEYSGRIAEASQRLSVLVTNILQVNRLENQKIKPTMRPFNLSEALSRCILNYDTLMEEKEIELDVQMDQNLILDSDENLLDMVWNNLISNAVKFTPEKGHIRVKIVLDGDYVIVTVADDGLGMNKETIRHIFDKFYQADTSRATQGNGLGLALAKRIINLLDGEISVESAPGKGSIFTVKL
ncbi:HAMP domain-containing sensor histidine kinase [Blautia sp. Sow4_E7]|uniref:HAMP domain-containing sensor histidine kinase n=1 Tax=Blautia sp. Sow4_E7 TaxID=3438749 RepID=UPI003F8FC07C